MLSVKRDPFARGEYVRTCHGKGTCKWCGMLKARVYSYTWESDDKPLRAGQYSDDPFCGFPCYQSYHA